MKVHNIVQEAAIKIETQEGKVVVWGGLTNSWEKKEVRGKGEKERYIYLNAEFQRISRRDQKAFLSYQCKEIEENNRLGKIRDLFKKIGDIKGTFRTKMGTIKDRKSMLLLLSRFSRVQLCATSEMAAHQAPPSLEFSRQEHWSGLPFPSPRHESEKWKWSCSVVSDS